MLGHQKSLVSKSLLVGAMRIKQLVALASVAQETILKLIGQVTSYPANQ